MHNSCILKKEGFGRLRLDTGLPDDKLRQFCEGSDNLSAETLDLLSMHFSMPTPNWTRSGQSAAGHANGRSWLPTN